LGKKLVSKKQVGVKRVFDLDIAHNHNFAANGTMVHNCTEKGAQKFFESAKPKSITDIAALTSIYRPGPLAADVDKLYKEGKNNPEDVVYDHPRLKEVLEETYGTIVFQEQIMIIAERVAGLPPEECDSFRRTLTKRSMAKKDKAVEELRGLKVKFVDGCMGYSEMSREKSEELFQKLLWFSGYGFNKSFNSNTLVSLYTEDGDLIAKQRIDKVQAGSFVRSRCERTNSEHYVRVVANHDHGQLPLWQIELESGKTVECTLDHKFRTECGQMLPVWQIMRDHLSIVEN